MSSQVLARKWRPQTFEAVVGQPVIVQMLQNALNQQRLHHAYLFTGTHGTGKTTLARILAKCLNCESGPAPIPCGTCPSCIGIQAGQAIDFIEVDAASRTKVEDTRELLENLQYAPSQSRFKIYLIDEVHMLSTHSFNALLKTLEEPPPHVTFLLATTDPQKLPPTVLSRCLQLHLHKLTTTEIAGQFAHLLKAENIPFEEKAFYYLADCADGSLRDALSLLDQSIVYSNGKVTEAGVIAMLGTASTTSLYGLLEAIIQGDPEKLLKKIHTLNAEGADFESALKALITLFHDIALFQVLKHSKDKSLWLSHEEKHLGLFAEQLSPSQLQQLYAMALKGRKELPLAPTAAMGLTMLMLRMLSPTEPKRSTAKQAGSPQGNKEEKQEITKNNKPQPKPLPQEKKQPIPQTLTPPVPVVPEATAGITEPQLHDLNQHNWPSLITNIQLNGMAQAIIQHASFKAWENNTLHLILPSNYRSLLSPRQESHIMDALCAYFQTPLKLRFHSDSNPTASPQSTLKPPSQADTPFKKDPHFQTILNTFDGKMINYEEK